MKVKRMISIVVCVVMVLSLVACGNKIAESNEVKNEETSEDIAIGGEYVQIANPWIECADIDEAVKNAGFSFEIPETIGEYKISYVQNCGKEMINVTYVTADDSETEICLRKGIGAEDISGDYNVYSESNQVTVGDYSVVMKGNDGLVSLATWTTGDFAYSLNVPEMDAESVAAIIQQIK